MVTKEAYINHSRLKLLLVLAWCNHSAGAVYAKVGNVCARVHTQRRSQC